jgi:hypothetical protein
VVLEIDGGGSDCRCLRFRLTVIKDRVIVKHIIIIILRFIGFRI